VGDERIISSTEPRKRRLGKEIREVEPEPEDPVVRSPIRLASRRPTLIGSSMRVAAL